MPIDVAKLREHLNDGTTESALLKAHLWVETMLVGLIEVSLPRPEALKLERATFAQKINIAAASGGLQQSVEPWVRALNGLRNKLAHQLDAEASDDALEDLASHVAEGMSLDTMHIDADTATARFRSWVVIHLLALEWHRMRLAWRRDNSEGLVQVQVQAALLALSGSDPDESKLAELRAAWDVPDEPTYRDALKNWPLDLPNPTTLT